MADDIVDVLLRAAVSEHETAEGCRALAKAIGNPPARERLERMAAAAALRGSVFEQLASLRIGAGHPAERAESDAQAYGELEARRTGAERQ